MPTYRGNRGSLLQHWLLCELVAALRQAHVEDLCFVDGYSMSPVPTRSLKADNDNTAREFDRVRAGLDNGRSPYEQAWHALSQSLQSEYPSSATFVRHCWEDRLHLLLCELDPDAAEDIEVWLRNLEVQTTSNELCRGDWRIRFAREIPDSYTAYLLSFDPNMCSRRSVRARKPENFYPDDIATLLASIERLPEVPIVVQLSTYSVNGPNRQTDIVDVFAPRFQNAGFGSAQVRADGAMMSMIFARDLDLEPNLEERFQSWLGDHQRRG